MNDDFAPPAAPPAARAAPATVATAVFIGTIRPLPESGRATGMYKTACRDPVLLGPLGFAGDQQADTRVHGGPDKAVHVYPPAHLARLAERFAQAAELLRPGAIGENLSAGLDESTVRIGQVWRLGEAMLQVCQPRNPCWKIDERFGCPGMAAWIVQERIAGWYARVLQPGIVRPGDALRLERAAPQAPTLREALEVWHAQRADPAALRSLAATDGIAAHWRNKIEQRLDWLAAQR